MIKIKLVDQVLDEIEKRMQADLVAYESSHGIDVNYKQFSLVMEEGVEVIGVLNAFTAFSEVYFDDEIQMQGVFIKKEK